MNHDNESRRAAESDLSAELIIRNTFVITMVGAVGFLAAILVTMV